jgi:hypothetical protein
MKNIILLATIVGAILLTGCADLFKYKPYAREVKRKSSEGGVIALKADYRDEDRALADTLMKRTCGAETIRVTEEGEVAVGTATSGGSSSRKGEKSQTRFAGLNFDTSTDDTTQSTSQTTELREWRINYECGKSNSKSAKN